MAEYSMSAKYRAHAKYHHLQYFHFLWISTINKVLVVCLVVHNIESQVFFRYFSISIKQLLFAMTHICVFLRQINRLPTIRKTENHLHIIVYVRFQSLWKLRRFLIIWSNCIANRAQHTSLNMLCMLIWQHFSIKKRSRPHHTST